MGEKLGELSVVPSVTKGITGSDYHMTHANDRSAGCTIDGVKRARNLSRYILTMVPKAWYLVAGGGMSDRTHLLMASGRGQSQGSLATGSNTEVASNMMRPRINRVSRNLLPI